MSMEIVIRPALLDDIAAILDITQEAFHKYAFDLGEGYPVKALGETEQSIADQMTHKTILIGELDGQPVGSIRYEFINDEIAYISRFGVKLVAQSCGMGGALVNRVVHSCIDQHKHAIALHTCAKMYSLIRFYYGKGFFIHSTATDRGYLRALLVKELDQPNPLYDYRTDIPCDY